MSALRFCERLGFAPREAVVDAMPQREMLQQSLNIVCAHTLARLTRASVLGMQVADAEDEGFISANTVARLFV